MAWSAAWLWLWLWHGPAAVPLIRPLAWEPPHATNAALKTKKKKKRKMLLWKKVYKAQRKFSKELLESLLVYHYFEWSQKKAKLKWISNSLQIWGNCLDAIFFWNMFFTFWHFLLLYIGMCACMCMHTYTQRYMTECSSYIKTNRCTIFFFFVFCLLSFEGYISMAYRGSQAKGWTRAVAASLHHSHSNTGSKPHLWPTLQHTQHQILNPRSKARDWTYILMDISLVC